LGKLKRPWSSGNFMEQWSKMQDRVKDMQREAGGFKKKDKAKDRRANNKQKTRRK
jgi:hypothetical protein